MAGPKRSGVSVSWGEREIAKEKEMSDAHLMPSFYQIRILALWKYSLSIQTLARSFRVQMFLFNKALIDLWLLYKDLENPEFHCPCSESKPGSSCQCWGAVNYRAVQSVSLCCPYYPRKWLSSPLCGTSKMCFYSISLFQVEGI